MQKSLLKSILAYIPSMLGERGVAVLSVIVFTRLFSPDEYGRYALALSFVLMAEALFMQWLRLSYLRYHAIAIKEGHLDRLNGTTLLIVALTLICVSAVSYGLLQIFTIDPRMQAVLTAAIFYFAADMPFRIVATGARASERALTYGVMDVGRALAGFILAVLLIEFFGMDERAILLGPAIAFAAAAIAGALHLKMPFSRVWSGELAGNMLRYGLPLIGVFLLTQIMSITDRLCLQVFIGSTAVGLYAVGFNLANNSMMMMFNAINLGAFPLLVNKFENADIDAVKKAFTEKTEILLALALPAAVGLSVGAENIAYIMTGKEFAAGAAAILPMISVVALCAGLKLFLFDQVFHLYRKSKQQLVTLIPPVILNVALNVALIPVMGIQGAVLATLVSSIVGLVSSAVLSRALLVFEIPFLAIGKIILASTVMGSALTVLSFPLTVTGMIAMIACGGALYAVMGLLLNILNARTILMRRLSPRKKI